MSERWEAVLVIAAVILIAAAYIALAVIACRAIDGWL